MTPTATGAFDVRIETIQVRGAAPVVLPVRRSVHGPVVATTPGGVAFTQKRAHWQRELSTINATIGFNSACQSAPRVVVVNRVPTPPNPLSA
jgi:acyl-homoserine lactone acylase PvdQ